ncbi:8078_t:CDS:2 [Funneliformis geosporum]|uniref:13663_t:CDS:1 n=1 Tax=Funneliformis geosporum TaxID=1117311 RepID=A0A9W4WL44_9GLOM|nr:13663_t:CDS:2 [Funneliformis geosporum]CAI2167064.1 8078_t:CDS:2 [Funneliformis geosporum]
MKGFKVQFLVILVITLCILNVIDAAKCNKNKKCPGTKCCTNKGNCVDAKNCGKSCQKLLGKCNPPPTIPPTTPTTSPKDLPISADGNCGEAAGTRCEDGVCCSQFGFCGVTTDHCQTGCQSSFGTCGTPGNSDVIDKCTEQNTIAITFDDGPRNITEKLLDELKAKNVKATFFMNGHASLQHCIYDYAPIVQRAFNEGHQIASHTWSHPHLPELSEAEINYQLETLEVAFKKIIGAIPTYARPPFGEHNALVRKVLKQRGYKMVIWDIDTLDWQGNLQGSTKIFDDEMNKSPQPNPHIVLNHDTIDTTPTTLGPHEIRDALKRGYKVTTVGDCLGQSNKNDWYRDIGEFQKPDSTWKCTFEDMHEK